MTQGQCILEHMTKYGGITQREAMLNYGISRLSARVWELRHLGYNIVSEDLTVDTRWGKTTVCNYKLL